MKQDATYFLMILVVLFLASCSDPDIVGPDISILTPSPNDIVTGTVSIVCMASDPSGVDYLELWVNGNNTKQTDNTEPFELFWFTDTLDQENDYMIVVRAFDHEGNISDSNPLPLDVFHSDLVGDWTLSNLSVEIITRASEAGTFPSDHARGDTVIWVSPTDVAQYWNVSGGLFISGHKTFEFSGNWLSIDHDSIPSPVSFYSFDDAGTWNNNSSIQKSITLSNCHLSNELDLIEYGNGNDSLKLEYLTITDNHNTWAQCRYTWFFKDCDDYFEIMVYDTIRYDVRFTRDEGSALLRSHRYPPPSAYSDAQLPNKGTVVKVKPNKQDHIEFH